MVTHLAGSATSAAASPRTATAGAAAVVRALPAGSLGGGAAAFRRQHALPAAAALSCSSFVHGDLQSRHALTGLR